MSIARHVRLAVGFACLLLPASLGCQSLEPDGRFDDSSFGEFGQSMRKQDDDSGGKWGVNEKSRQIEANLGM